VTAVQADSPVSWWRVDEVEGTLAHDTMNRNNGALWNSPLGNQPSLVKSDPDAAMRFNGTSQYVAVPDAASLRFGANLSLEAWLKPTSLPAAGAFASIVTKAESYSLQFNGPRLEFTVMQSGVRRRLQAPAGAIVAGSTYHVVGTYDGSTQRLYVNGSQVASATLTGVATSTTNPLRIASWNGAKEFFAGTLDEVAVYGTTLSAARVAAHFSAGTGGASASPSAVQPSATASPAAAARPASTATPRAAASSPAPPPVGSPLASVKPEPIPPASPTPASAPPSPSASTSPSPSAAAATSPPPSASPIP